VDFLGIGPMELLFILLIALIVLGPKEMLQASRTIGKLLRKFFTSESWREFRRGMESVKNLPYQMAREAGLDEELQTISQATKLDASDFVLPINENFRLKTIDEVIQNEASQFDSGDDLQKENSKNSSDINQLDDSTTSIVQENSLNDLSLKDRNK